MLKLKEDRRLVFSQRVQVYRNLRDKCFSIRDKKTQLICAHGDGVLIKNAICKVSDCRRQKVLREKLRNVHAWIEGDFVSELKLNPDNLIEVYYNPYECESFIIKETGLPISNGNYFYFLNSKCYILETVFNLTKYTEVTY